jgi:hypothetical protein
MLTDDQFVDLAYDVASKRYYKYKHILDDIRLQKDDYIQDAVMYLFKLYKNKYFELDPNKNIKGLLYSMLRQYTLNRIHVDYKKEKKKSYSLDIEMPTGFMGELETKKDHIPSEDRDAWDYIERDLEIGQIDAGEKILKKVVNRLDPTPYKSYKYAYMGNVRNLGKPIGHMRGLWGDIKLSEQNLGKMLFHGLDYHDVLKVYGVDTPNIGTSSEATFVQRKFKAVIKKLTEEINNLNEEDREAVKKYIKDALLTD